MLFFSDFPNLSFYQSQAFYLVVLSVDPNHIEIAQVDYDIGDSPGNIIFFFVALMDYYFSVKYCLRHRH